MIPRAAFVALLLSLLVVARVLDGFDDPSFGLALLFTAQVIFAIVALGALMAMHHQDRRSSWELPAFLCYPPALFALLGGNLAWTERSLWIFCGYFAVFIAIGGFLSGIFLSPLAASWDRPGRTGARPWVRDGARFIHRGLGLTGFAVALFLLTAAALYRSGQRLVNLFPGWTDRQLILFWLGLILPLLALARYTYRHTRPAMRNRLDGPS